MQIHSAEQIGDRSGRQNVTQNIQRMIDKLSSSGGGTLIMDPGCYQIGTIRLRSHVTLRLDNALIIGSCQIDDYPDNETSFVDAVDQRRGKALIYAYQATDIGISGKGTINGRGYMFDNGSPAYPVRPFLIRLVACRKVLIQTVNLEQSASWGIHLQECDHVQLKSVNIHNRCNDNNDGIDIDGCHDVEVDQAIIDSGDDGICLKTTGERACERIFVHDSQVTSRWAGFKIGTESVSDFIDVKVRRCRFFDVDGCAIKIVPTDGGNVKHLSVCDIDMVDCTGPLFVANGKRLRKYFDVQRTVPGKLYDLLFQRIQATVVSAKGGTYQGKPWGNAQGCVVLTGIPSAPFEKITVKDCEFQMPGGHTVDCEHAVPEMEMQYPEFHQLDPLPAWGLFVRHGKDFATTNNTFELKQNDVRQSCVLFDVRRTSNE